MEPQEPEMRESGDLTHTNDEPDLQMPLWFEELRDKTGRDDAEPPPDEVEAQ